MDFNQLFQTIIFIALKGVSNTFLLSFGAFSLGLGLGSLLAFMQVLIGGFASKLIDFVTRVLRSIPPILMLFIVFYGFRINNVVAAIIGLGIISSAYQSQILRGVAEAVAARQLDAALSIGLDLWGSFRSVILPQVVLLSIPALLNEFTTILKDSSIAYAIGVVEMFTTAINLANARMEYAIPLVSVSILYIVICFGISYAASLIHRKISLLGYGESM
ncbi:ABC transporter permease subunit [Ignisphaera sp. 4213-co]|uniref:ABC transporter permease subunit n=1 Tax=Ignisphaera cupida TaxID=3050454 RepID=A0ABD4Z7J6_9CREN|nr:ABC transporter permease subunit [Ignisphaera sp. 4213-co]MDK6028845.1 ABC transporter permease subunit [Ignisphaera sp. 4213-co]